MKAGYTELTIRRGRDFLTSVTPDQVTRKLVRFAGVVDTNGAGMSRASVFFSARRDVPFRRKKDLECQSQPSARTGLDVHNTAPALTSHFAVPFPPTTGILIA